MRLTRVYCPVALEPGCDVALPAAAAQHVTQVLRLRSGDALELFDGSGHDCSAELVEIIKGRVTARVLDRRPGMPESPLAITLVQAVSRGERMDLTLQKATELGVRAIVPVLSTRSIVRLDGEQSERKLRHWRGIVTSACEQSGRSVVPDVCAPLALHEYLAGPGAAARRFVLSPAAGNALAAIAAPGAGVELLIGPEGGLDASEHAAAERAGFEPVHLGPRVLRTETAGLVALAVLQAAWGDLKNVPDTFSLFPDK